MEKKIGEKVDFLEGRILKLIDSYENLNKELTQIRNALVEKQLQNKNLLVELEELQKKHNILKSTNALLGSDEHKKETKHKINALIREIDVCIAQLS